MEFLDIELFNQKDLVKLFTRFLIDFSFTFVIVRVLYFAANRRKDYLFTFIVFNLLTFFICFLLRKVPMELGFALGLFAVFGILRYRTEPIPIKEMTYLLTGSWRSAEYGFDTKRTPRPVSADASGMGACEYAHQIYTAGAIGVEL